MIFVPMRSKNSAFGHDVQEDYENRDNLLPGEGGKGVGEEPNHTTARKLVPL
jgi:hypothetical protein